MTKCSAANAIFDLHITIAILSTYYVHLFRSHRFEKQSIYIVVLSLIFAIHIATVSVWKRLAFL